MKFKVGDKIKCINGRNSIFLENNKNYTVTEVYQYNYDGMEGRIRVDDFWCPYNIWRFTLVERANQENKNIVYYKTEV